MLRPVLLCLAVALASVCAQSQLQAPPPVYSYRVELSVNKIPPQRFRVWYDSVNRRTRVDSGDGQVKVVWHGKSNDYPLGVATMVSPITTEFLLNVQVCTNASNDDTKAVNGLVSFLMLDIPHYYQLVGKEPMRDEVADKWSVVCPCPHYVAQDNFYFAYRELHGVRQYVQLRRHLQLLRDDRFSPHDVKLDVYDFDTSDIDPEIFNIQKGRTGTFTRRESTSASQEETTAEKKRRKKLSSLMCDMEVGEVGKRILRQHLHASPYHNLLQEFKEDWGRREIIRENMEMIEEHNRGNHSYKMAANHRVIDRTEDEIKEMLSERVSSEGPNNALPFPYTDEEIESLSAELPEYFDWRDYGAVTPSIETDAYCTAGWANAALGAVEGVLIAKNNFTKRTRLSEQPILDCSWGFGNRGCASGLEVYAFDWIKKYGVASEFQYGKFARGSFNCRINEVEWETSITDYVKVKPDENALRLAIVKHGPVTVRLATTRKIMHYTSGIYDDPDCPKDPEDYSRTGLAVGYGTLDGRKYWIVRDIFGPDFVADGCSLIAAGDNTCGILNNAYYVII